MTQVRIENAKITTAVQNRIVDELPLVVRGAQGSEEQIDPDGFATRDAGLEECGRARKAYE